MAKMNVVVVYGTRPELIKVAPLILKLKTHQKINLKVISTGQHREMLTSLEEIFGIKPDVSLNLMTNNQTVSGVVSKVMDTLEKELKEFETDLVFVQGDTATVLATAMTAYFSKIRIAHVEAGLRSHNLDHPFPEEFNRKTVSIIADYNFAPTELSANNLRSEGIPDEKIFITGNTVIDSLQLLLPKIKIEKGEEKIILVTAHRRENHGRGIDAICEAIKKLIKIDNEIKFIWPLHPNPNVGVVVRDKLSMHEQVELIDPLGYLDLITIMKRSTLIWTDSGGIQEEAPSIKKPVLILREVTERPEVVDSGFGRLVGTDIEKIVEESIKIMGDQKHYQEMISGTNPFGDGKACEKIIEHILR